MNLPVQPTPFHMRTAALDIRNTWLSRNGLTLARDFGDPAGEALAARTAVAISDISFRWRAMLKGERVEALLSRLATRDLRSLTPGEGLKALWLNDGGAVRGAGLFARYGRQSFLLASASADMQWISDAAQLFGVGVEDRTAAEGGVAVVGPYAARLIGAAGLEPELAPLAFRKIFWGGLDVTLSRWGEHGGYEVWCAAGDAIIVWDRLLKAGAAFGCEPAGADAMDTLDIEAGIARPERDYSTAGDAFAETPTPGALGLESLIDESFRGFNGRDKWLSARTAESRVLAGIELDSGEQLPKGLVSAGRDYIGQVLASTYSPALRRTIGLVQISGEHAGAGTMLTVACDGRMASARVTALPFLPPLDPIPE